MRGNERTTYIGGVEVQCRQALERGELGVGNSKQRIYAGFVGSGKLFRGRIHFQSPKNGYRTGAAVSAPEPSNVALQQFVFYA
jgi:hypothetical protein